MLKLRTMRRNNARYGKLLLLLGTILLTLVNFQPKTRAQDNKLNGKLSLELLLSSRSPMLRIGDSSMLLVLEVRNVGMEAVKIDKKVLWRKSHLKDADDPDVQFISFVCGPRAKQESDEVVIEPGTSIWDYHEYSLKASWFENGGSYTLSMSYGGVESNKIPFELINENLQGKDNDDN